MVKAGRNASCPCGSGRKYKHCCHLEEERLARQARADSRVGLSISDWSVEKFGDELAQAFEEFHPESHRIGERDFELLLTWFNSDRDLRGGGTPVARYLDRPDLDPVEREVAGRIAAARLGLHRVRVVVPGRSLELENVLTGTVIPIVSQSVSREVVRWDVVLCRVMAGEPVASLWGPVLVYAPDEEPELLAELERLAAAHGLSCDRAEVSEVFRIASRELLRFVPPSRLVEPSYFTAEGDPIVSASAVWRLADPDAALVSLDTPPELLWVGGAKMERASASSSPPTGRNSSLDGRRCRRTRSTSRVPTRGSRTGSGPAPSFSPDTSFASTRSPSNDSHARSSSSRAASQVTRSCSTGSSWPSTWSGPSKDKRSSLPRRTCWPRATSRNTSDGGWTSLSNDSKGAHRGQPPASRSSVESSNSSSARSRTAPNTHGTLALPGPTSAGSGTRSTSARNSLRS